MNMYFLRLFFLCFAFWACTSIAEENFLLIHGQTDEKVLELGSHIDERMTPCSTFKIALCLMGFDARVLEDETTPTWNFEDGYDDYLESWKSPQTPQSWIKTSCVWYSRLIATSLGLEKMQYYLNLFQYGNQDLSEGLTQAWICSSLQISTREQVYFIQKMLQGKLGISNHAMQKTRVLLFVEELPDGGNLFGKTGWSGSLLRPEVEIGWFVGWIEKEDTFFPFAYNIKDTTIDLSRRIQRVKELWLNFPPLRCRHCPKI